jgi:hypothetical protein
MKLRLLILTLLCAAVAASNAQAGLQLQTVARDRLQTTSRVATKDCGFQANYTGVDDLLLECGGPHGSAKAKYDFYLPSTLYGTPAMHVYGDKLCCAHSRIRRRLVKVAKRHYRIVVSVAKRTRFDLRSVSLSYYVTT